MDVELLTQHIPAIWSFSDSNHLTEIPTTAFMDTPGVRVFQTTSPAEKRWKSWTKEKNIDLYIMDVPSGEEITDFAYAGLLVAHHHPII